MEQPRYDYYVEYRLPHLEPEPGLARAELFEMATAAECLMVLAVRHKSPIQILRLETVEYVYHDEPSERVFPSHFLATELLKIPETIEEDFAQWVRETRVEEKHK